MDYQTFINRARTYANGGEAERLNLMALLIDTEPRKAIWQPTNGDGTKRSWDLFLREEGLCTPGLYRAFKHASKIVDVKVFGVYASAAIGKLNSDVKNRVVRETQAWIRSHHMPPTYQRISKYVRDLHKELGLQSRGKSTPIHALKAENNRLKRELAKAEDYIDVLQAKLKQNNIRIPKETP